MSDTVQYTEVFAGFILEARDAYNDLREEIRAGRVPADQQATIRITLPAAAVDQIRRELLAEEATDGGE